MAYLTKTIKMFV